MNTHCIVTAEWLNSQLGNKNVKIFDASWHMPDSGRNGWSEFNAEHIPGAQFFDIDKIADTNSTYPHTLPSEAAFTQAMQAFGLNSNDKVVIYDNSPFKTASRSWWMLRAMGHDNVAILNGGLSAWKSAGYKTKAVSAKPKPSAHGNFQSHLNAALIRGIDDVFANLETKTSLVIDARANERFYGKVPEPRPGLASGHIPGALNFPFSTLYDADGFLRPANDLRQIFANLDTTKPLIASCGSGVTACSLALALYYLGNQNVAVYDGSWSEWGMRADMPIETDE